MTGTTDETVGRSDIEAKLREIQGEVDAVGRSTRPYAIAAGAVVVVVVVALAFTMGRRRETKKRTVVEIRRV